MSDRESQPISHVLWIDLDQIEANNYNPNSVAKTELKLLQTSILADGYTQPVVTFYDEERDMYTIVDGFHRFTCCKINKEINRRTGNKLPIVVIKKDINDRMASTVRHNRARGKHSIEGMSDMVFKMLENGMSDTEICSELGMEAVWKIEVENFPAFIVIDNKGNDFFKN